MPSLCLNPLGIGEGFEPPLDAYQLNNQGLNPLGIGEGFEHSIGVMRNHVKSS